MSQRSEEQRGSANGASAAAEHPIGETVRVEAGRQGRFGAGRRRHDHPFPDRWPRRRHARRGAGSPSRPRHRRADRSAGAGTLSEPRAHLAQLQSSRAARGPGSAHAAARAGQVPGDRQLQPRRVLHEADRRPQAAGRRRGQEPDRGRADARAADRGMRRVRTQPQSGHPRHLPRGGRGAAPGRDHPGVVDAISAARRRRGCASTICATSSRWSRRWRWTRRTRSRSCPTSRSICW